MVDEVRDLDLTNWPFERQCPIKPAEQYAVLRERPGLQHVKLWNGKDAWLATSYSDVRQILKNATFSADTSRPDFPQPGRNTAKTVRGIRMISQMDSPRHDELRRMVAPDFMLRAVRDMTPEVEACVNQIFDEMERHGPPLDLVESLCELVPARVTMRMLGFPEESVEFFLTRFHTWVHLDTPPEVSQPLRAEFFNYLSDAVDQKVRHPGDDITSRLIQEQLDPGYMSRDELLNLIFTLILGGLDTTANVISLGVITFLESPRQLDDLRANPELVRSAVEELLRYLTVTHSAVGRVATEESFVGEQRIRVGESIIAPVQAANYDPTVFERPDEFDVRRDPRNHLAFGFGLHQCLGQQLARLELQTVFGTIFTRFPNLALAVPFDRIIFKDKSIVYGAAEVPVTW